MLSFKIDDSKEMFYFGLIPSLLSYFLCFSFISFTSFSLLFTTSIFLFYLFSFSSYLSSYLSFSVSISLSLSYLSYFSSCFPTFYSSSLFIPFCYILSLPSLPLFDHLFSLYPLFLSFTILLLSPSLILSYLIFSYLLLSYLLLFYLLLSSYFSFLYS